MFKKGQSGNPHGRPLGAKSERVVLLENALFSEGKKLGKNPWNHVAERFYQDNSVMIAVVKKFVPDSINIGIDPEHNRIIVEFKQ